MGSLAEVAYVVVTTDPAPREGAHVAATPEAALAYLAGRGFSTALVGGGAATDASFLSRGLIDELYLNVEPVLTGPGLTIPARAGATTPLTLVGTARLSPDIVQLRYRCGAVSR
jgi:riboflavin biosynthesis pyrimidine reductase